MFRRMLVICSYLHYLLVRVSVEVDWLYRGQAMFGTVAHIS